MNHSGDAAEQIIRISLEGVDYAIRIVGSGAKNLAVFLLAVFKSDGTEDKTKLRGKERLINMLKSGKETKIFAVKNGDLKQFAAEAKRYGVAYCVLKEKDGSPNSTCEIMARAEDASKISRIVDRLEFAAIPIASAQSTPAEREVPDRDDTEKLLDALLGEEGKDKSDQPEADKSQSAQERPQNPMSARNGKERPPEPRSGTPSPSAEDTRGTKKPKSVKEFLRERTAAAKQREDKRPDRAQTDSKKSPQKTPQHKQPQRAAKKKTRKKERG